MQNQIVELSSLSSVNQVARHPEKTTERYGFIPTAEVIEVVKSQGLYPVQAREAGVRAEENRGYQKHLVRFRFDRDIGRLFDVGDEIPELVLINSHMGSASFQFKLGLFRCVCRNQLVVASGTLADIRIPHSRYAPQRVAEGIAEIVEVLPRIHDRVSQFKAIELRPSEEAAYAEAALPLRFDTDTHEVRPDSLLARHRYADAAPTLWNVFNAVQENIIRGGVTTQSVETGRRQRSKRVASLGEDIRLNTALWRLTERMAQIKGAN